MNQINKMKTGDICHFGEYEWLVLDVQDQKALLLSKYVLEERAYHRASEDIIWEDSDIRSYLNGEFYDGFNETDKARIVETQVINNSNTWCGTKGGNDTTDKVFLLSLEEVVKYFGDSGQLANKKHPDNAWWGFSDQYSKARTAVSITITGETSRSWWWLRSPGSSNTDAVFVSIGGVISVLGGYVDKKNGGVRPAMWININNSAKETYSVEIVETLSKVINVEAASQDEAIEIVKQLYRNQEVVLDASDFIDGDVRLYK